MSKKIRPVMMTCERNAARDPQTIRVEKVRMAQEAIEMGAYNDPYIFNIALERLIDDVLSR